MRFALALAALVVVSPAGAVEGPAPAKELPAAMEAAWIVVVKDYKTEDGTTVLQALLYAEKLRPKQFKVGSFDVVYNGGTGDPDGVAIDFWIGAKREPDDSFSMLFGVQNVDGKAVVESPKTQDGGSAAEAAVSGRDGLLRFIDEQYRENCIDNENGATLC